MPKFPRERPVYAQPTHCCQRNASTGANRVLRKTGKATCTNGPLAEYECLRVAVRRSFPLIRKRVTIVANVLQEIEQLLQTWLSKQGRKPQEKGNGRIAPTETFSDEDESDDYDSDKQKSSDESTVEDPDFQLRAVRPNKKTKRNTKYQKERSNRGHGGKHGLPGSDPSDDISTGLKHQKKTQKRKRTTSKPRKGSSRGSSKKVSFNLPNQFHPMRTIPQMMKATKTMTTDDGKKIRKKPFRINAPARGRQATFPYRAHNWKYEKMKILTTLIRRMTTYPSFGQRLPLHKNPR